ncbi:MAG: PhoH family protein [Chlamydiae bacterium]|nr:PhoH family protein [Chlamydiota bacterium]
MARKTYVVDTNVILHDAQSLVNFGPHDVVIPGNVIEELDRIKRFNDEMGRNARQAMRFVDRMGASGNLQAGILLEGGSKLRVVLESPQIKAKEFTLTPDRTRYKFFCTVYDLKEKGEDVVIVSKDSITRIIAETIGIATQNYATSKEYFSTLYRGIQTLDVQKKLIDEFYKDGHIELPKEEKFSPNEFCILKSAEGSSAICRVDSKRAKLVPLAHINKDLWGIKPKNVEQKCAIDLLLDDNIKLVTFVGQAGTGKTLLALAAGLRKVFDEGVYSRIIITRSVIPVGKDIGYLPGTKEEKLRAWMGAFYDNLEYICGTSKDKELGAETQKWIVESNKLQVEAITYMRGRSIANSYIIIDEAQNLTPHEMKTLISRVGPNTKVIVLGDPTQIDNAYLDSDSNGLVYLIAKMKKYHLYGNIFFKQTERSELAALASEVL